jgi:sugar lactone lactonase YvrE
MAMTGGTEATVVVEDLVFGEGPRWHDDALWFSDIHGGAVHRLGSDGRHAVVAEVDDRPSGLGWLASGEPIVVAMETGRLLRLGDGGVIGVHADLSALSRGSLNDMIVRSDGTAFVGDMGSRIFTEHPDHTVPGQVLRVTPDGAVGVAWDDLRAPNGMVLTPDERTLILAESGGFRLLAFDVADDGSLGGQRVFADLPPAEGAPVCAPDGICLDADGAVWVADPLGARVVRVVEGGAVTDEHVLDGLTPVACVLGGADRRTLFVCAAEGWRHADVAHLRTGRVLAIPVDVPGAGRP